MVDNEVQNQNKVEANISNDNTKPASDKLPDNDSGRTDIEKYECDECGKTFSSKASLRTHKWKHSKEKRDELQRIELQPKPERKKRVRRKIPEYSGIEKSDYLKYILIAGVVIVGIIVLFFVFRQRREEPQTSVRPDNFDNMGYGSVLSP